jgi:hypothetical protein
MAEQELLPAKVRNAIEATKAFVTVLESEGFSSWGQRFRDIQTALEAGDTKTAIHLLGTTRHGGMGSLSDIMVADQRRFDRTWDNCSKAIGNVRLYLTYGFDRPEVKIDDA